MKTDHLFSVLMYHEVSVSAGNALGSNYMTPIYNIKDTAFKDQLSFLKSEKSNTRLIEDVYHHTRNCASAVFLTFDDGCIGNYDNAFPLLLKYRCLATFFITTNLIGTQNYMSWDQVRELVKNGMSVQSHAMNHLHLTDLNEEELMDELVGSKKMIEENVSQQVVAISLPHGSYNKKVIKYAVRAGYKIICTSDVIFNSTDFNKDGPILLGRVAVTTKMTNDDFVSIINNEKSAMVLEKMKKGAKNSLKRIIGINNYGRLYRLYFNIRND